MTEYDDVDAMLMGVGVKGLKFESVGDTYTGIVVKREKQQMRDYVDNTPMFWEDGGNPKFQIVITLETDIRDDDEDDGMRKHYVKPHMIAELSKAIRASGAKTLEIGSRLTMTFAREEPSTNKKYKPKKVVTYKIVRPVDSNNDDLTV